MRNPFVGDEVCVETDLEERSGTVDGGQLERLEFGRGLPSIRTLSSIGFHLVKYSQLRPPDRGSSATF